MRPTLLLLLVVVAGCSGSSTPPASGEGVVEALESRGNAAERIDSNPPELFSVGDDVYRVDGGELHLFRFASASAAEEAAGKVGAGGYTVGTMQVDWIAPPHWFRSGGEIALYLGSDEDVLSALEEVAAPQFAGT